MATSILHTLLLGILVGHSVALPAGPLSYVSYGGNSSNYGALDEALDNRLRLYQVRNFSTPSNQFAIFPPGQYLGHGLDMTAVMPLDIQSVTNAVANYHRMIDFEEQTSPTQIAGGAVWTVPNGVNVGQDVNTGDALFTSFEDGKLAESSLDGGGSLSIRYKIVQGDASVDAGIHKVFQQDYQYGLFGYTTQMATVAYNDEESDFDEAQMRFYVDRLQPFDPTNRYTVSKYKALFHLIGTHVITKVNYGARLSVTVWADNSNAEVNENFNLDVAAGLAGLPVEGKVDANIKGSSQFQTYQKSAQRTCSCLGGNPALASKICANTQEDDVSVYEIFQEWSASSTTLPDVTGFSTRALWDLMTFANDTTVANFATDLSDAFNWLVSHPQTHLTPARITISSDWAEMGMLSPGAYLEQDPNSELAWPDSAYLEGTKVWWNGTDPTHPVRELTIDVLIRNYGTPVDIYLAHGSNGETPITGRIQVEILGATYVAEGIIDNGWNEKRFPPIPVDMDGVDQAMLELMADVPTSLQPAQNVSTAASQVATAKSLKE